MEGFNNPFGSKERDIKLDHKKLQLEHALGQQTQFLIFFYNYSCASYVILQYLKIGPQKKQNICRKV